MDWFRSSDEGGADPGDKSSEAAPSVYVKKESLYSGEGFLYETNVC